MKGLLFGSAFACIAFCLGMFAILGKRHALQDAQLKLTAWNKMQGSEIENSFKSLRSNIIIFTDNRGIMAAYADLLAGWDKLEQEITTEQAEQITKELEIFYNEVWLKRLRTFKQDIGDAKLYIPATKAGKWVQLHYIAKNPYPHEEKYKITNPTGIENDYTRAHAKHNKLLTDMVKQYEIADLIFIDHNTGNQFYSSGKQVDLGQNFMTGVFKDINQAKAFKAAAAAQNSDFTLITDFESYEPDFCTPTAFISSPLIDGSKKLGVMLLQIDPSMLNKTITVRKEWEGHGMSKTGELLLLRQDLSLLTQSRLFVQDAEAFYKRCAQEGMPVQKIQQIKIYGSPLLVYKFAGSQYANLVRGDAGTAHVHGFYSDNTLAVYRPLQIQNLTWSIVAMQSVEEIYSSVYKNTLRFAGYLVGFIIFMILIIAAFKVLRKEAAGEETNAADQQQSKE